MEKNQKQAKKINEITRLFENLAKSLKQDKFYEAYHFVMVARMSFEDTIRSKKHPS